MMDNFLNPKIQKFEPYSLNSDIDLDKIEIRLDANESFSNLPDYIVEDIQNNIKTMDFNRYPDPAAKELTKKYAGYLKASEDAEVGVENIAVGNGSDELLSIIINAFLSKGDKILTFAPDFSMYAFYGDIIEADVIKIQKHGEDDFAIDFDEIAKKINSENIKLAVFSNPCNPTGRLEKKETLERFIKSVNAVVVLDEVYMSFAANPHQAGTCHPLCKGGSENSPSFLHDFLKYPNLIIMKSLSKAIGLAAIRVGFALSNEVFVNTIKTIKSPFNVNSISQTIAKTVLCYPDYLAERLKQIKENKKNLNDKIINLLVGKKDFKVYDTKTNFVLIETNKAKEIFDFLLAEKILVRNLANKFLRITTGSEKENEKLIGCLKKYLTK